MGKDEYGSDRKAIQQANGDAFDPFLRSVADGLIGQGVGDLIANDEMLAFRLRDIADRILVAMDGRGIGLHKHDVPPRKP